MQTADGRVRSADAPEGLQAVADRVRPLTLAEQRLLPVLDALVPLLPEEGVRRGTLLGTHGGAAATSLALALVAGPTAAGSWVAVVGMPQLGLAAAGELGVALDRLALVRAPEPARWATVVAALLDAFDVVMVQPPRRLSTADARRLSARARERGAVLVAVGAVLEGSDVRLEVTSSTWSGLGAGHGHLCARRVEVCATGRRAAARERRVGLWLPDADGQVRAASSPRAGQSAEASRRVVLFPGLGVTALRNLEDAELPRAPWPER